MSHANVERVIGRLLTDEAFRRRFAADPVGALESLSIEGVRFNPCECQVLRSLDLTEIGRLADRLDPRIRKSDLKAPV